jgi:hypothetical protein
MSDPRIAFHFVVNNEIGVLRLIFRRNLIEIKASMKHNSDLRLRLAPCRPRQILTLKRKRSMTCSKKKVSITRHQTRFPRVL